MTPVEERIDHAAAWLAADDVLRDPAWHERTAFLARAVKQLLTEHSAREQKFWRIASQMSHTHGLLNPFDPECSPNKVCLRCNLEQLLALPATESAQPQNYQVDSIDMGGDPPNVPGDLPPGAIGPTGSGASE